LNSNDGNGTEERTKEEIRKQGRKQQFNEDLDVRHKGKPGEKQGTSTSQSPSKERERALGERTSYGGMSQRREDT